MSIGTAAFAIGPRCFLRRKNHLTCLALRPAPVLGFREYATRKARPSPAVRQKRTAERKDASQQNQTINLPLSQPRPGNKHENVADTLATNETAGRFLADASVRNTSLVTAIHSLIGGPIAQQADSQILATFVYLYDALPDPRFGPREESNAAIFRAATDASQISLQTLFETARNLLKSPEPRINALGWFSMRCCAQSDHSEAALLLGTRYLRDMITETASGEVSSTIPAGHRIRPNSKAYGDFLNTVLGRLTLKGDLRAATLRASLTSLTDPVTAIPEWETALGLDDDPSAPRQSRYAHLSRPWLDAATLHDQTFDDEDGAARALKFGLYRDDSDAFAGWAALAHRKVSAEGRLRPSEFLDYLNSVTKAAASGSVPAMIDLGLHYADDCLLEVLPEEWHLMLQDQPERSLWTVITSWWPFGANKPEDRVAQESAAARKVAEFAVAFRTPEERIDVAVSWLTVAADYGSIEAHWYLFQLRMRKFISDKDNSSLPSKAVSTTSNETEPPPSGVANPMFSMQDACRHLDALAQYLTIRALSQKSLGLRGPYYGSELRIRFPGWFTYPAVAQMNEDWVRSGRGSRPTGKPFDPKQRVHDIADTLGLDLLDERGHVLRRYDRFKGASNPARVVSPDTPTSQHLVDLG